MLSDRQVWFTRNEAAKYIRLSSSRLAHLASEGIGPRFYKNGRTVRYHRDDLDAWIMFDEVRAETPMEEEERVAAQIVRDTHREFFGR